MQPISKAGLSYSLAPDQLKAIESKILGRKIKNWIKPGGGITSILIAAAFAGAIIAVVCLKPKFEKSILGVTLGSTAAVSFAVGTVGGFVLIARHGYTANQRHKLLKEIGVAARAPQDTSDYIIDTLDNYTKITDLIPEEINWIAELKKGLKEKAKSAIKAETKEKSSQCELESFKERYIDRSGLTLDDLNDLRNRQNYECYEHLKARPRVRSILFPGQQLP